MVSLATYAFPRSGSSMSFFAKVLNLHPSISCRSDQGSIWCDTWVSDQRNVHIVVTVSSCIEETNLAATTLWTDVSQIVFIKGLKTTSGLTFSWRPKQYHFST